MFLCKGNISIFSCESKPFAARGKDNSEPHSVCCLRKKKLKNKKKNRNFAEIFRFLQSINE